MILSPSSMSDKGRASSYPFLRGSLGDQEEDAEAIHKLEHDRLRAFMNGNMIGASGTTSTFPFIAICFALQSLSCFTLSLMYLPSSFCWVFWVFLGAVLGFFSGVYLFTGLETSNKWIG